ncbi:MAG: hypothetical protein KAI83_10250 [Thiomargarita sp.]|nr:hypothetical protein [Thiomargarita sp.]
MIITQCSSLFFFKSNALALVLESNALALALLESNALALVLESNALALESNALALEEYEKTRASSITKKMALF